MANGRRGRLRAGSIVERTVERKDKSGKVKKRKEIFARVTFLENGKRKDKLRRAESRTHAKELIQEMLGEIKEYGTAALDHNDKTFADLADYYEKHYLNEARYENGEKVSGLRSLATPTGFLKTLRAHFGKQTVHSISYGDVRALRDARRKAPTRGDIARHQRALKADPKAELKVTRSITSVNRELALLRHLFNLALNELNWIRRHPMHGGKPLIIVSAERKRERIITLAEEAKLLAACTGKRVHLRPIIIAALETGMRKGELLKMTWSDIDFERSIITVKAFNTKTMRAREVGMTARLNSELEQLGQAAPQEPDAKVFDVDDVKRSFDSARSAVGLTDVRFHDLRHTYASRLISLHIPNLEVGRLLGHTQANTTYRYVNANTDTARRAAEAMNTMRATSDVQAAPASEAVN